MTGKYFVDTNIWIYAIDASDSRKSTGASSLIHSLSKLGAGILSVQTLGEFSSICTKKLGLSPAQVNDLIQAMDPFPVVAYGRHTIQESLALMSRTSISFWDAVMVSTAREANCTVIYTEDLNHNQVIEGIQIWNPFIEVPNL